VITHEKLLNMVRVEFEMRHFTKRRMGFVYDRSCLRVDFKLSTLITGGGRVCVRNNGPSDECTRMTNNGPLMKTYVVYSCTNGKCATHMLRADGLRLMTTECQCHLLSTVVHVVCTERNVIICKWGKSGTN
jgi:hypothetical protein